MFLVGNIQLSKVMNSNGSDEKRLKLQKKADQSLEGYPLLCREIAAKQKNFDNFKNFVNLESK